MFCFIAHKYIMISFTPIHWSKQNEKLIVVTKHVQKFSIKPSWVACLSFCDYHFYLRLLIHRIAKTYIFV